MRSLLLVFTLGFALLAPGANAATSPKGKLPNFLQVADGIYRSGRPLRAGLEEAKEMGVRTIINIEDDAVAADEESRISEELGLRVIRIPMDGMAAPTDAQVDSAIAALRDPASQPVLLHCRRGSDRTGVVFGIFRVEQQGWTAAAAFDEMKKMGFLYAFFPEMRKYFENRTRGH